MTHDHLGTAVTATITVVGGGITAAWVWILNTTTDSTTELGVMAEAVKAAPSFVATLLVIYVVTVFLKHLREMQKEFHETLSAQRKESVDSLDSATDRMAKAVESMADNMDKLAEGQSRILEAMHGCSAGKTR